MGWVSVSSVCIGDALISVSLSLSSSAVLIVQSVVLSGRLRDVLSVSYSFISC